MGMPVVRTVGRSNGVRSRDFHAEIVTPLVSHQNLDSLNLQSVFVIIVEASDYYPLPIT